MENCTKLKELHGTHIFAPVMLSLLTAGILPTIVTIVLFAFTYKEMMERQSERTSHMVIGALLVNDFLWLTSELIRFNMKEPEKYHLPAYYVYIFLINMHVRRATQTMHSFLHVSLAFSRYNASHVPFASKLWTQRRSTGIFLAVVLILYLTGHLAWSFSHRLVHHCRMNDSHILTYVKKVEPMKAAEAAWTIIQLVLFIFLPGLAMTYFMAKFSVELLSYYKAHGRSTAAQPREKESSTLIHAYFALAARYCTVNFPILSLYWIAKHLVDPSPYSWYVVFCIARTIRVLYFGTTWAFVYFLFPKFISAAKNLADQAYSKSVLRLYRDSQKSEKSLDYNDIVLN